MFNKPGKKLATWSKVLTVTGLLTSVGMVAYKVYVTLSNGVLLSYDALITDCLGYVATGAFIVLIGLLGMTISEICDRLNYICSVYLNTAKQVEAHEKERLEKEKERLKKEKEREQKMAKSQTAKPVEVREQRRKPQPIDFAFPEDDFADEDEDDSYNDVQEEAVEDDEDEYETLRRPIRKVPRRAPVTVSRQEEEWDDEEESEDEDDSYEEDDVYEEPVRPVRQPKPQPKKKPVKKAAPQRVAEPAEEPEVVSKKKKKRLSDFFFEEAED